MKSSKNVQKRNDKFDEGLGFFFSCVGMAIFFGVSGLAREA